MTQNIAEEIAVFQDQGFVVLKDAISIHLIDRIKDVLLRELNRLLKDPVTSVPEGIDRLLARYDLFSIQKHLIRVVTRSGLLEEVLLNDDRLRGRLINFLGPDLACQNNTAIFINHPKVKDPLYRKDFHQDYWSGGGLDTLAIWFPIIAPERGGGMRIVPGSHLWGLLPNRNRKLVDLPVKLDSVAPEIKVTWCELHHPLVLHATDDVTGPGMRIAIALVLRNYRVPPDNMDPFHGFTPIHESPLVNIRKKLGNACLTPFRTLGGPAYFKPRPVLPETDEKEEKKKE